MKNTEVIDLNEDQSLNKKPTRKKKAEGTNTVRSTNTRTRKSKRLDSSSENMLPEVIPKTQSLEIIEFHSYERENSKLILQVPISLLLATQFTQELPARVENYMLSLQITKDPTESLICSVKFKQIAGLNEESCYFFHLWGKFCWLSSQEIQNRVIKKVRKEVLSEYVEFLRFKIKDAQSDLFIILNIREEESSCTNYNGLINQGNTCYMNSYLQMLYHIPQFRNLIFSADVKDVNKFPATLQSLFYKMDNDDKPVSPEDLVKSFGWGKKDVQVQQDAQEFSCLFFEVLENTLNENCANSDHMSLNELFEGQLTHYIQCTNMDFRRQNNERFFDIQLGISKDLSTSFDEYVEEHHLTGDNIYRTDEHGLQQAHKGVKISILPPILMIQIKRFEYNPYTETNQKILDRFEYPKSINFKKWTLSGESDQYQLYGVLVHEGSKASSGHYYAYLKCDETWFKLNDELVQEVTEEKAINYNFGGNLEVVDFDTREMKVTQKVVASKATAYMLVYMNTSMKEKLLTQTESYPGWLKKQDENKLVLEKEKKARKLYIYDIPWMSYGKHIKGTSAEGTFGFFQKHFFGQEQTMEPIRKDEKVKSWLARVCKDNEKAVYLCSNNSHQDREIIFSVNNKPQYVMNDIIKDTVEPFFLFTDLIVSKTDFLVVLKLYEITPNSKVNYFFDKLTSIKKQGTNSALLQTVKDLYEQKNYKCRYYIEDKKSLIECSSDTSLIPPAHPARNQLLLLVVEKTHEAIPKEEYREKRLQLHNQKTRDMVTICLRCDEKDINQEREIDQNTSIQDLREIIFHDILKSDKKFISPSHILLKHKAKKLSKVFTEITKAQNIRDAIKADSILPFSFSALKVTERILQTEISFYYRFKDFTISQELSIVIENEASEEKVIETIVKHPTIIEYSKKEGFDSIRVLLMSRDLSMIKNVVESSGHITGKGDIRAVLLKQKNSILVLEGQLSKEKEVDDSQAIVLIHQLAKAGQKIGIPRYLRVRKDLKLTELKNCLIEEVSKEKHKWDEREYTVNPFKLRFTAYLKEMSRGVELEDEDQFESDSKNNVEEEKTRSERTIGDVFNKHKIVKVAITHSYLTKGQLQLKLNVD